MELSDQLVCLAIFLGSAFLKGITGLGFSTLALPIMASVVDLKLAIPLVIVPSLTSNILVMKEAGHFTESCKRFWPLYISAVPGLIIGLWLLNTVESTSARTVLGAVLTVYALWALSQKTFSLSQTTARVLAPPVGIITGVVNGLTGSQVFPVMPYLLSLGLDKNRFIQAINIGFTFSSLIMLTGLGRLGLLSWELIILAVIGIVPVWVGIKVGGLIRQRLSEGIYRKLVLVFLVVVGLKLVVGI